MRSVRFERDFIRHPDGSCLASFGETRVLCTAIVAEGVPRWLRGKGQGWLTAEYGMLPGSTNTRSRRPGARPPGRTVEIQRLIGRSLRAAVRLDALGEWTVHVDCDVLQADGGTRTAAISGAWVAVADALRSIAPRLERPVDEVLAGQIAAVSVGLVDGKVVADLDYEHDSRADVDMNIVTLDDAFVEIQGTGERTTFDRAQLTELLAAASEALDVIRAAQRAALEERPA